MSLFVSLIAASTIAGAPPNPVVTGSNALGVRLLKQVTASEPLGTPVTVSPIGLTLTLGMLADGASGPAQDAILKAIGLRGVTPDERAKHVIDLRSNMKFDAEHWERWAAALGPNVKVNPPAITFTGSIWLHKTLEASTAFAQRASDVYNASVQSADLFGREMQDQVGQWASNATSGAIRDFRIQVRDERTRMIVLQATYFKDSWAFPFDPKRTAAEPFHVRGGSPAPRPMMRQQLKRNYFEDSEVQCVSIPYDLSLCTLDIVIPKRVDGLPRVLSRLTDPHKSWWAHYEERMVDLHLPKWAARTQVDLRDALGKLGHRPIFENGCDFSAISPGSPEARHIRIGAALQESNVVVDEEGTEVATITALMGMTIGGPRPGEPVVVRADRPFLWFLRHPASGTVLFSGTVVDPMQ